MRLYTADLTGDIKTTEGSLSLHHFISAQNDQVFTKINMQGNESYSISWHPAKARSTRTRLFPYSEKVIPLFAKAYGAKYNQILKVYKPNPSPEPRRSKNISLSIQNLLAGGQYAVGWKEEKISSGNVFIVTIKSSYPGKDAEDNAKSLISSTTYNSFDKIYKEHTTWWNQFYRKIFLSIPDKKLA